MAQIPVVSASSDVTDFEVVSDRVRALRDPVNATAFQCNEGGDYYENDGAVFLIITNNGASPHTVTRLAQRNPDPAVTPDEVATVAAGESVIAAPVNPRWFNDTGGNVQVRYETSAAADLEILAIRSIDVR